MDRISILQLAADSRRESGARPLFRSPPPNRTDTPNSGYSIQAMGGVAFRWQHIGIYTEAKYQANITPDVDASGIGLFAGMSVHF